MADHALLSVSKPSGNKLFLGLAIVLIVLFLGIAFLVIRMLMGAVSKAFADPGPAALSIVQFDIAGAEKIKKVNPPAR